MLRVVLPHLPLQNKCYLFFWLQPIRENNFFLLIPVLVVIKGHWWESISHLRESLVRRQRVCNWSEKTSWGNWGTEFSERKWNVSNNSTWKPQVIRILLISYYPSDFCYDWEKVPYLQLALDKTVLINHLETHCRSPTVFLGSSVQVGNNYYY